MDTTTINNLATGDSMQLIKNLPGLKVSFNGLDLTDSDYDSLQFTLQKNASLSLNSGETLSGDFMLVSSGKSNAFYQSGGADNRADTSGESNVYVLVSPYSLSSTGARGYYSGTIFYLNTSSVYATSGNSTLTQGVDVASLWTKTLTNSYSSTESSTI